MDVIEDCFEYLLKPLHFIVNSILKSCTFRTAWMIGKEFSIPKSNNKNDDIPKFSNFKDNSKSNSMYLN